MAFSLTGVLLRSGRLVLRVGAQAVPVGGVFVLSWPAAGGLILYWIESVLVLGATTLLLSLFVRRTRAPENAADLAGLAAAGIRPRDVLLAQGGALSASSVCWARCSSASCSCSSACSPASRRSSRSVPFSNASR